MVGMGSGNAWVTVVLISYIIVLHDWVSDDHGMALELVMRSLAPLQMCKLVLGWAYP